VARQVSVLLVSATMPSYGVVDRSRLERAAWVNGQNIGDRLEIMGAMDQLVADFPVDTCRQYVTGISMGGFATWDIAVRFPERFAAVVPICGGGDPARVGVLARTPAWCFHGERDDIVSASYSCEMIEALRAAGSQPNYSELQGVRHDSWTPAYRETECLEWLFEKRRLS
jgi:predicted peptidase